MKVSGNLLLCYLAIVITFNAGLSEAAVYNRKFPYVVEGE